MPDVIDIAQERAAELLELQIKAARKPASSVSAFFCESCGEPIPEARRRIVMGVKTCASCQELIERRCKVTGQKG